jgi:hypothetical protein
VSKAAISRLTRIAAYSFIAAWSSGAIAAVPDPLIAQLAQARSGDVVRVPAGRHAGPFRIPDGVGVIGEAGAELTAPAGSAIVNAEGSVKLTRLTLRGGQWGVLSKGQLVLDQVTLLDQGEAGLRMDGGQLQTTDLKVQTTRSGADGVVLQGDSEALLTRTQFVGPFRRAIRLVGAAVLFLSQAEVTGAETAIHAVGGQLRVQRLRVGSGATAALFLSETRAVLEDIQVQGHEYGLLLHDAEVKLRTFHSVDAQRSAIALVKSSIDASGIQIEKSGNLGAIQTSDSVMVLDDFELRQGMAYGLIAIGGRVQLKRGEISDVKGRTQLESGEGVHLDRVERATLEDVTIHRTQGPCMIVLAGSRAELSEVQLDLCGTSGLEVASKSRVSAIDVVVHQPTGPAMSVAEGAEVAMERWLLKDVTHNVIELDCTEKVRVYVDQIDGETDSQHKARPNCVVPLSRRPADFAQ